MLDDGARAHADAIPQDGFSNHGVGADAAALAEHDVGTNPGTCIHHDVAGGVNRRDDTGMPLQYLLAFAANSELDEQRHHPA